MKEILNRELTKNQRNHFFSQRRIEEIDRTWDRSDDFGIFSGFFEMKSKYNFVLFIDATDNQENHEFIKKHAAEIRKRMTEKERHFILLPEKLELPEDFDLSYYLPGKILSTEIPSWLAQGDSSSKDQSVLDLFNYDGKVTTGFLSYLDNKLIFVEKLASEDIKTFVENFIAAQEQTLDFGLFNPNLKLSTVRKENLEIDHLSPNIQYSLEIDDLFLNEPRIDDSDVLLREIEEKLKQLVDSGQFFLVAPILEKILKERKGLSLKPSPIRIDQDYRILLPDYDIEINMHHLTKSLYFLFLKLKTPVSLFEMDQYRQELLYIYKHVSSRSSIQEIEKSIREVTEPGNENIYMHISRIKKAFNEKMAPEIAGHYYPDGFRGKPKKIKLPKSMINWDCDFGGMAL